MTNTTALNNYLHPDTVRELLITGLQLIAVSIFLAGAIIFLIENVKRWWIRTEPARIARGIRARSKAKNIQFAIHRWRTQVKTETSYLLDSIFE